MPIPHPRLWVVATPLGNIDDLSPRARSILSQVDYIIAEDTRKAQNLLRLCTIPERRMMSFHDHNEEERLSEVLDLLRKGCDIALISDAGTPLISDPGYRLVRMCRKLGFLVSPVPGPSACIATVSCAGLPPLPFTFLGFVPRDAAGKKKLFLAYATVPGSLVFFERSDRVKATLALAYEVLGNRDIAICRELTKIHEECICLSLASFSELPDLLGEMTLMIGPPIDVAKTGEEEVLVLLQDAMEKGLSAREIVKSVQKKVLGFRSKELYALLESCKHKKDK